MSTRYCSNVLSELHIFTYSKFAAHEFTLGNLDMWHCFGANSFLDGELHRVGCTKIPLRQGIRKESSFLETCYATYKEFIPEYQYCTSGPVT